MKNLLLVVLGGVHGLFVNSYLGFKLDDYHFWFYTMLGSVIIYLIVDSIDETLNKDVE